MLLAVQRAALVSCAVAARWNGVETPTSSSAPHPVFSIIAIFLFPSVEAA